MPSLTASGPAPLMPVPGAILRRYPVLILAVGYPVAIMVCHAVLMLMHHPMASG